MKKDRAKIPTEQLTAYERWELPLMNEGLQQGRLAEVKLPTAADLEKIQQEAYREGFRQGKAAGQRAGFEEGRQQGHQQGHEAGLKQGVKAGTEQGESTALANKKEEINQHLQQLDELLSALQLPLQSIQQQTEETLVNLVLAISRAVVFRELQVDSTQIARVVNEALAALPTQDEQATIFVNPQDAALLQRYAEQNSDLNPGGVKQTTAIDEATRVVADTEVMVGGCRVETRHTLLDFTVEKRFQQVVQQMLARQSKPPESPEVHDFSAKMGTMSDLHRDVLETTETGPDPANDLTVKENLSATRPGDSQPAPLPDDTATDPSATAVEGVSQPETKPERVDSSLAGIDPGAEQATKIIDESVNDQP